ncbi:MAG TPA: LysR family transcriptional regulator [Eoetvoesiella sp.]|uniref:LysR family transcriptional regulator n=1 Tax=Eoetvoesiella sp. TaxID=1966355 RepID=UPI002BDA0ABF|nr:LysR family transcriptional regulator [Eoetvoesiella sp.]HWK62102.1 LysR family transcriptional regulator [Eoetvoesiella sp.]
MNTSKGSKPPPPPARTRLDLNLLNVFDMVMTERHVTRAAERLDMTQSAVSNALNRLRRQFQDQLFVKAAKGVQPTPKAISLWPRIHQSLEELQDAVQPRHFDAASTRMRFRIAMTDITAALLTPHLHQCVHSQAPLATMFFVPDDPTVTGARLMRGEIDFVISIHPPRASIVQSMPLWSDALVAAARCDHPLLKSKLSLAAFCEAPQIAINAPGDDEMPGIIDTALDNRGLKRNVSLSINQFSIVTTILRDTDLITVLPARFTTPPYSHGLLATQPLPFSVPDVVVYLSWHQRSGNLPTHQWFRQAILEAATRFNMQTDKYFRGK